MWVPKQYSLRWSRNCAIFCSLHGSLISWVTFHTGLCNVTPCEISQETRLIHSWVACHTGLCGIFLRSFSWATWQVRSEHMLRSFPVWHVVLECVCHSKCLSNNFMLPKRRFWKVGRTFQNAFSKHFSRVWVLYSGDKALKTASKPRSEKFVRPSKIFVWEG